MSELQFLQLVRKLVDQTPQVQRLRDPLTGRQSQVVIRAEPALLDQLAEAVDQKRGAVSGASRFEHSEPINLRAVDVWNEIAAEAADAFWIDRAPGTRLPSSLQEVIRSWSQYVSSIASSRERAYAMVIDWAVKIRSVLEPSLERNLGGVQCAACGCASAQEVVEVEVGKVERRSLPALVAVVAEGTVMARCRACGVEWFGPEACSELAAMSEFGLRITQVAGKLQGGR